MKNITNDPVARIVSPCVSICALNDDDVCVGCFRSGQEISQWGRLTDDEKRHVLARVQQREQACFSSES